MAYKVQEGDNLAESDFIFSWICILDGMYSIELPENMRGMSMYC
jgi:hypothetical protein